MKLYYDKKTALLDEFVLLQNNYTTSQLLFRDIEEKHIIELYK